MLTEQHCEKRPQNDLCGITYVVVGVPAVLVGTVLGIAVTSMRGPTDSWSSQ
jgi:hypothetical protein